jgi:uncharacterized protein YkwD
VIADSIEVLQAVVVPDNDRMKKSLLLLWCVSTLFLPPFFKAQEVTSTTEMERQIFEWTNQERAKVKAPPLKWNERLAIAARLHSDEMVKHNDLSHQVKGEPVFTERLSEQGARFSAAAENVGYGEDAQTLQDGWMTSPPHRANLLNPVYTDMGIGIVRAGDRLWATEDFATTVQKLSSEDFEKVVEEEIASRRRARGMAMLKASSSSELRRIACSGNNSAGAALSAVSHGNLQAYSFNFTAPKPQEIPADLVGRVLELPAGSYVIGACASQPGDAGMTTYRVLIVLSR